MKPFPSVEGERLSQPGHPSDSLIRITIELPDELGEELRTRTENVRLYIREVVSEKRAFLLEKARRHWSP